VESWPGGFHRDAKQDESVLARNPLPSDQLDLQSFRVGGYEVDYRGTLLVAFRLDARLSLIAFGGYDCARIRLNGRDYVFADRPLSHIAWAPVSEPRRVSGGAILELWVQGQAQVKIPVSDPASGARLFFHGARPGAVGEPVPSTLRDGFLEFEAKNGWPTSHLYLLTS
jgi:hypothetical protein